MWLDIWGKNIPEETKYGDLEIGESWAGNHWGFLKGRVTWPDLAFERVILADVLVQDPGWTAQGQKQGDKSDAIVTSRPVIAR